ncbi:MAG: apolipoprotein N-acyltransferase [Bacteroidales bacterium]|nr:apolipoprotein N-acyltransferase [Bacteroidales bacterium]
MKHIKSIYLWGIALTSGILLAAAFPDKGFTPSIFFAFFPLLWVEDYVAQCKMARTPKIGHKRKFYIFGYVYLAFLIWNIIVDYWIWYSSPAASLCWTVNALLQTLAFCAFHWCRTYLRLNGLKAYLLLAVFWLGFEYFHFNWDVSFPWLTLGNYFSVLPNWVQWYEYTGVLGGSLWVLIINVMFFVWVKTIMDKARKVKLYKKSTLAAAIAILLFVPIACSSYVFQKESPDDSQQEVEVVVVQPNIDPYGEQYFISPQQAIERMLTLASYKITPKTRFIVTPESMIQEYMWHHRIIQYPSVIQIKKFLSEHPQITLIAGISSYSLLPPTDTLHSGVRFRSAPPPPAIDGTYPNGYTFFDYKRNRVPYLAHNAVIALDTSVNIPIYNKSKLTPAVEIMPFVSYFPFLERLALNLGGTVGTLGIDTVQRVFTNGVVPFSDIICYESIYGDFVRKFVQNGAELLFISTNDGWWRNTAGHRQHLSFARLRAIETRREIARSANTGISCFIDKKGRMFYATPYNEKAAIRQTMHPSTEITFYTKHGDYIGRAMLLCALLTIMFTVVVAVVRRVTIVRR